MKKDTIYILEEDIRLASILTAKLLSTNKYHILEVSNNALNCISYLSHNSCDLLIIDLMLSKIDGISVLQKLKQLNETAYKKVICMTSFNNPIISKLLNDLEVTYCIKSPIDIDSFLSTIDSIINVDDKIINLSKTSKKYEMIKLENVVLASPEQMEFIIQGMRNPMNSWEKSDTCFSDESCVNCYDNQRDLCDKDSFFRKDEKLGSNDHSLMQRLSNADTEHRKYMRMMPVYVRITAPLYWWKEFDTYKVGTVANSCSTMHKIAEKEFTLEDFSTEHLISDESIPTRIYSAKDMMETTIKNLNMFRELYLKTRDKTYWWQMIQLLPSNYNQTRNVMLNYEVLANIYRQRKNHKLDEWREVCKWIESLPYNELITVDSREAIKEELRKEIWKHMALLNTLKYIQIS